MSEKLDVDYFGNRNVFVMVLSVIVILKVR